MPQTFVLPLPPASASATELERAPELACAFAFGTAVYDTDEPPVLTAWWACKREAAPAEADKEVLLRCTEEGKEVDEDMRHSQVWVHRN